MALSGNGESDSDDDDLIQELIEIDLTAEEGVASAPVAENAVEASKEHTKASKACLIPLKACVKVQEKAQEKQTKVKENASVTVKEADGKSRDFKCRSCDFAASTKRLLVRHQASVHEGVYQGGDSIETLRA